MAKTQANNSITAQAFPNFSELEVLLDRILDMPDLTETDFLPEKDQHYFKGYNDALHAVRTQIIACCKGF